MAAPLTITSPTNSHALAAYMALATLGAYYTFTAPQAALVDQWGTDMAVAMAGLLMFAGAVALSATIMGSRRRDPSAALSLEIAALAVLVLVLFTLFTALIRVYGYEAPSTIVFTGASCAGCATRILQGGYELHLLNRARRQVKRRTVEVTAVPERE